MNLRAASCVWGCLPIRGDVIDLVTLQVGPKGFQFYGWGCVLCLESPPSRPRLSNTIMEATLATASLSFPISLSHGSSESAELLGQPCPHALPLLPPLEPDDRGSPPTVRCFELASAAKCSATKFIVLGENSIAALPGT